MLTVSLARKTSAGISTFRLWTRLTLLWSDTVQATKRKREDGSDGSSGVGVLLAPCSEHANAESIPLHQRHYTRSFLPRHRFETFDGTSRNTLTKGAKTLERLNRRPFP